MMFRSRRLETILGGRLDAVSYQDIAALKDNSEAAESEDLDYKREVLANDPKSREEFAKDLVEFANHLGGVFIVGMAETKGVPSSVTTSDVSDAHQRHLQQVAARYTAPPVRFEMRAVPNPDTPGHGFLIIAVPRSPQQPHAITAPPVKATEHALRYPRRSGSQTTWMTENEVATAYYRRFRAAAERDERLAEVERELLAALPASNIAHLLVTLVPETPGDMQITRASFSQHKRDLLTEPTFLAYVEPSFTEVRIGARRVIAHGGQVSGYWYQHCELHRDGSATFAMRLGSRTQTQDGVEFAWADPSLVVYGLLSALRLLGSHARDRCGATGTAQVKACIVDAPHSHPQGPNRPQMNPMPLFRIDNIDHRTGMRWELSTQFSAYSHSEVVVFLDDLADGSVGLVQAGSLLADELFQAFGIAEAAPITRAGEIQIPSWASDLRAQITQWARDHDVPILPPSP